MIIKLDRVDQADAWAGDNVVVLKVEESLTKVFKKARQRVQKNNLKILRRSEYFRFLRRNLLLSLLLRKKLLNELTDLIPKKFWQLQFKIDSKPTYPF